MHVYTDIYMTLFCIKVFLNPVSGTVPSILFYAFFQWAVFLSSGHTAVCKSSLLFLTLQSFPSRPLSQYLWCELLCVHCGHVGMWAMLVYRVLAHAEVYIPREQEMCFHHSSIPSN